MSSSELPGWAAGYLDKSNILQTKEQTANREQIPAAEAIATPQRLDRPALLINDAHARIEGRFETTEEIEIGCDLTGEIVARRLHITQSGKVSGVVHTVDAVIAGRFEGDIIATGSLDVVSGGFLGGNVQTDGLTIARGAVFRGQVQQLQQPQPFQQSQHEPQAEAEPAFAQHEPAHEERRAVGPLIAVELPAEQPALSQPVPTPVRPSGDVPREGAA